MKSDAFYAALEEILAHPVFQQGFTRRIAEVPELPLAQARRFALAYYPHILAEDERVQAALASILADEYGHGEASRTHMQMYRHFLRGVGVPEDEIAQGGLIFPELRLYIDAVMRLTTQGDWLEAAAATGIAIVVDVEHTRLMKEALRPYAETSEGQVRLLAGTRYNLDARWVMMQGLERLVFAKE
jgi:pyrroloquinoline quinone (PQQ) biosynthesis protein C